MPMASPSGVTSLPPELVLHILQKLDHRQMTLCTGVCKAWREVITTSTQAKYAIELGIAGHEDGCTSLDFDKRLAHFRRHQEAWRNFEWTSESVIPMYRSGYWELCGNVHAQTKGELQSLVFTQIPSKLKGIESKQWEYDLDFPVRDFSMDPSQDLLVVIQSGNTVGQDHTRGHTCHVHLLQLSTGKPHAQACRPAILSHLSEDWFTPVIAVNGRHVAVLLRSIRLGYDAACEFIVWNWKTGAVQAHLKGNELLYFSFLSEYQVLLACARTRPQHGRSVPYLLVADINDPSDEPTPLQFAQTACVLEFPELAENLYVESIHLRSDLTPPSRDQSNIPFQKCRDNLLFVATLWLDGPSHAFCALTFIPSSTIFSAISTMSDEDHLKGRRLAWEEWGPTGTRMCLAPPSHSDIWVCYVSGLVYGVASEVEDYPPDAIHLYDFNQDALRYTMSRGGLSRDGRNTSIVLEPTEIPANAGFKQAVRTSLPYVLRTKVVPDDPAHAFRAIVLAEDAIVTVCNSFDTEAHYRILSF